jgi:anti-anti-sigma factor
LRLRALRVAIVRLLGEHDLTRQKDLAETLQEPILTGHGLIVDLSETQFIDSAVLNNLLAVKRLAHKRKLPMVLQLPASSDVAQVLELSGLNDHFDLAHSRHEALRIVRDQNARGTET